MRGLSGKRAIVTGGGSGIGRSICERFGEEGVQTFILDINAEGADQTARGMTEAGAAAAAFTVDISSETDVRRVVADIERSGAVDILVNNAGWDEMSPFLQTDTALWKKIIDINLYGPLHLHHAVLPGMVKQGAGSVINISSDAGRVGSSGEAVYSACKGGIAAFGKTIARELARDGVRINTVCPGPTDTPLFDGFAQGELGEKIKEGLKRAIPLKRLATPADFPGIVSFLASDDAAYITGQTISVSGGLTMHG